MPCLDQNAARAIRLRQPHFMNNALPEVKNAALLAAVREGRFDSAHQALLEGADPNQPIDVQALLPLHVAAHRDDLAIMQLLLDHGASPNAVDGMNDTALHVAAAATSLGAVELLIRHGAGVQLRGCNNATPLTYSIDQGSFEITQYLLDNGATMEDMNKDHGSALHVAAPRTSPEITQLLIDRGADVNAVDQAGETPLHYATSEGGIGVMSALLLAGANPNAKARISLCTPLDHAIELVRNSEDDQFDRAKLLVEHGATLNHWGRHKLGYMCREATQHGHKDLVELYLDNGCNLNGPLGEYGSTLLGVAATFGHLEIEELLLDRGACAEDLGAVLRIAINNNRPDFVDLLLRKKPGGFVLDCYNSRYLLRVATLEGNVDVKSRKEMLKVLTQNEIDIDTVVDMLGNTALHEAAATGRVDSVRALVELEATVNAKNRQGATPLILACRSSSVEAVQILLETGKADIHCTTNDGSHALDEAVYQGLTNLTAYLLAKGASVDLPGHQGATPLTIAVQRSDIAMVKTLLDAGADVSSPANLLEIAIEKQNSEILNVLLDARTEVSQRNQESVEVLLSFVCECNNKEDIIKSLMAATTQANKRLDANSSAFHAALSRQRSNDVSEVQLAAGTRVNIVDSTGNILLESEALADQAGGLRLLLKERQNPSTPDSGILNLVQLLSETDMGEDFEKRKEALVHANSETGDLGRQALTDERPDAKPRANSTLLSTMENLCMCPITFEIMQDPVVAPDGHSYERSAITKWLTAHATSPMTQQAMNAEQLIPNFSLKHQIDVYLNLIKEQSGEKTL